MGMTSLEDLVAKDMGFSTISMNKRMIGDEVVFLATNYIGETVAGKLSKRYLLMILGSATGGDDYVQALYNYRGLFDIPSGDPKIVREESRGGEIIMPELKPVKAKENIGYGMHTANDVSTGSNSVPFGMAVDIQIPKIKDNPPLPDLREIFADSVKGTKDGTLSLGGFELTNKELPKQGIGPNDLGYTFVEALKKRNFPKFTGHISMSNGSSDIAADDQVLYSGGDGCSSVGQNLSMESMEKMIKETATRSAKEFVTSLEEQSSLKANNICTILEGKYGAQKVLLLKYLKEDNSFKVRVSYTDKPTFYTELTEMSIRRSLETFHGDEVLTRKAFREFSEIVRN